MTDASKNIQPSPAAPSSPGTDHYLRAVTDMAAHKEVLTQEAIYNLKGIKLVDKGLRVNRQVHERLQQHQLRHSFDSYLTVSGAVDVATVVETALAQCQADQAAGLWVYALGEQGERLLLAPVRAMLLPERLAFALTVMREQHPALFAHSVRVMLTAVFLGVKSGWSERECGHLACAALLHDLGVLHLDPVWHDPTKRMTGAGRQQMMAHPATAAEIIQEAQNVYPTTVGCAVLEHHECMDGSGYPRGLNGAQISAMGQVLIVAEVVAAFFEKYANEAPAQRLSLTLRLNHRKYPPKLIASLLPVLQVSAMQSEMHVAQTDVEKTIAVLSGAFSDWDALVAALPASAQPASSPEHACALVTERLAALQKTLFEAGSHPQQQAEALPHLLGDAQSLAELALLGREALWQLQSIVDATHSRWPQLAQSSAPGDVAVVQWRNAYTSGGGEPKV